MSVTALARVKTRASITSTKFDAMLTQIIDGLTALFERQTNRTLLRAEGIVALFDGGRAVIGPLKALPVEAITEIKEDANPVDFGSVTAMIDGTDFIANPDGGLITRLPRGVKWLAGIRNVRVTYTGGYVAAGAVPQVNQAAMPEDLQEAATMQAVHLWKYRDQLGVASISADGTSLGLPPAELLPAVRQVLKGDRRFPL